MNIIGIYITTVIVSFIMEIKREFEIITDVADMGYKFDTEKTVDLSNEIGTDDTKIHYFKLLIPVYNLMFVLKNYEDYYSKREYLYKGFESLGIIKEMSEFEKREYNKKRTGFHALVVQAMYNVRLAKATKVKLKDGSTIWYEYKENNNNNFKDNITILKVEGRSEYLSEEEQKRQVEELFQDLANKIMADFKNIEKFTEEFLKNNEINISKNDRVIRIDVSGVSEDILPEESIEDKLRRKNMEYKEYAPYRDEQYEEGYSDTKKKTRKR